MIAFFSMAFFFGLIAAVVSGVVWIVQRLRHRQTRARVVCVVAALVTVIGIVGISVMYEPTETVEGENTEPAQSGAGTPTETSSATPTPPVTTPEPEDTPQGTTEPPETEQNPLLQFSIQTRPVMNGFNTERIGTWAYIETTKAAMKEITDQQLKDYLTSLDDKGYNWFNVFFEDGTGLYCMTGMSGTYVEYGPIDKTEGGSVPYEDSRIYNFMDGAYQQIGGTVDKDAINKALLEKIPQKYQDKKWFYAYCDEMATSDGSVTVSVQIDQGTNDIEVAKVIAADCYASAKEAVESADGKLVSFSVSIVNNGSPVVLLATNDGVAYTAIANGKRSEFTIP